MMDKKLYKSSDDKMISGVCGGIAEYFAVDPTIVRLVFAGLTLMGVFPGIILYIIGALIIPERPYSED